ncbi:TetR/AcrR family transcriptional regulator [Novosphingobium album (ex Hu et al. 2023)]|uniref:TetR/AcrR family transcriptional regulator n=1 Tax=Novosphingobium album (ex Hu et al. 2023) TaxID=2930093 RepID=A0ABT0B5F7_9SPHN|nr:TetR/AcrR family transcriptional regulator [Novosphingobium album (ex Hu et al. 2023)]MCJ2180253.1 TetR/AcrR family transcriptional regulator [Novosphingobium album (ex Hu et al. 2023)]
MNVENNSADGTPERRRKRLRRNPEAARELILDVAEKIMREEGYAAVTTRRIAKVADLAPALVHYYFAATDDLFIALHRRMADRQIQEVEELVPGGNPVMALWNFQNASANAVMGVEFMAMANHRKGIREQIARKTEEVRAAQCRLIASSLDRVADLPPGASPECVATILVALARILSNEDAFGVRSGHDDLRSLVEWVIAKLGEGGAGTN